MIDVLLAEDVRRQDSESAARGISVETLMENAGWALARAARKMLGGTYGRRVVVLCGKGNNAGDGLVAARILSAQGARATAVLVFPRSDSNELARKQLQAFDGPVVALEFLSRELARADLLIDAVFGIGLTRAPEGAAATAIQTCVREYAGPVLAADVPSGVDGDTGAVPGAAVTATATVTFTGYKPGLLFLPGAARAGSIEVAGIGLPSDVSEGAARAVTRDDVRAHLPRRAFGTHKRSVGTVLVVAGSRAMPGAAALVCGASVHGGAGLTTLCAPEDVCRVVLGRVPEITTIPIPETAEGTLELKALDLIRPRLDEFHAIAVGPGLTPHPATVETVRALLAEARRPVVLDADGLNAFAGATELLSKRGAQTVCTPHAGELARLVGRPAGELDAHRLYSALDAARALNSIVVFKGPGTVIADPQGESFVNTTGGSGLAQGGTGDVLTGLLAALVAQFERQEYRLPLGYSVALGVWLHGYAADRLAARVSPHPANAGALIEELGAAMHEVCA